MPASLRLPNSPAAAVEDGPVVGDDGDVGALGARRQGADELERGGAAAHEDRLVVGHEPRGFGGDGALLAHMAAGALVCAGERVVRDEHRAAVDAAEEPPGGEGIEVPAHRDGRDPELAGHVRDEDRRARLQHLDDAATALGGEHLRGAFLGHARSSPLFRLVSAAPARGASLCIVAFRFLAFAFASASGVRNQRRGIFTKKQASRMKRLACVRSWCPRADSNGRHPL